MSSLPRFSRFLCLGFALLTGLLRAETTPLPATAADQAWAQITEPLDGLTPETAEKKFGDTPLMRAWQERWYRRYRDRGLAFWNSFPSDPRRYDWFVTASRSYVNYWVNPEEGGWYERYHHWTSTPRSVAIDRAAEAEWNLSATAMLPEFLRNTDPTKYDHDFLQFSLFQWQMLHLTEAHQRGDPVDVSGFLAEWERHLRLNDFKLQERHMAFLYRMPLWCAAVQDDQTARKTVLSIMRASNLPEVVALAEGQINAATYEHRTLDATFHSLTGEGATDLAALRGGPVLLDIYGLNCSSCWQQMPMWRELYKKYHPYGLNIVCAALLHDTPNEPQYILQRLKDRGVDWAEGKWMVPPAERAAVLTRFGEVGVPFHFLLDGEGKVVRIPSSPDGWAIERAVRKLLKLPELKRGEEIRPPEWPAHDHPPQTTAQ